MTGVAASTEPTFSAAVLAGLPDPVIVIDGEGTILHANAAAERVLGWPARDKIGSSVMELVHQADRQFAALSLTSIGAKETGTAIEVRVATSDGGWRHLEVIGTNLLDDPTVAAIVLVARDLTERRRWEVASGDESLFRAVVQHSAAITMLVHPDGCVASSSGALTRLLGHDPEHVAGRHLGELVAEADRDAISSALARAEAADEPITVEASFPRPYGDGAVDVELTIVDLSSDPVVAGFIVTGHDIRDRKSAEAAVVESQRQLAEAQELARLGSWEWDIATGIVTWTQQLIELFDLDEATYPRDYEAYIQALHPDDRAATDETVRAAFESRQPFEVDHRVVTRQGIRWLHGRGRVIVEDGVAVRMIGTCIDVTERLQLQEELHALSLSDPLTGLLNRRGFQLAAEQQLRLARRLGLGVALVYADLDNLKDINDDHGHHEGDRALREIGDLIAASFRDSDVKARVGGDEYAVFLIDAGPANAQASIERLRRGLEEANRTNERPYALALSIGAVATDRPTTIDAMLAEADRAMYEDKQTNRPRARLLVVEDDTGLRGLLERHLAADYDVTGAAGLGQAIDALASDRFDVVLLDRGLPDSRGPETLARIREAAGGARLVVMTGDSDDHEATSLRGGAADFIAKPFDLEVLDARLARFTRSAGRSGSR